MSVVEEAKHDVTCPRPKYYLDIEGKIFDWPVGSIIAEQVADLACWDPSTTVLIVDAENNERQLQPCEVVKLEPGIGFAKKVHWKRG
jgi:hypothetical protein